jgi:hypothetical protein
MVLTLCVFGFDSSQKKIKPAFPSGLFHDWESTIPTLPAKIPTASSPKPTEQPVSPPTLGGLRDEAEDASGNFLPQVKKTAHRRKNDVRCPYSCVETLESR